MNKRFDSRTLRVRFQIQLLSWGPVIVPRSLRGLPHYVSVVSFSVCNKDIVTGIRADLVN